MSLPRNKTAWTPPAPTFSERLGASLLRALVGSLICSLAFALGALLINAAGPAERALDVPNLIYRSAVLSIVLFGVLVPVLLILSTRPMQDRAFTLAGFLATFFGLAMLVIFFLQLASGAARWFRFTPRLIELENARLLEAPKNFMKDELTKVHKELEGEYAKIDADVTKTIEEKTAEKKELKELVDVEIIPEKTKELEATVKELERAAQRDLRENTSAPALLWHFLTSGPSDAPQDAGIYTALLGSLWLGFIVIMFAVPVGVAAAIYLEEYRVNSRLSRLIQVNINNLAGVPSVVYGILGAFIFVELIFKPLEHHYDWIAARNVLGGGLTLGLLTLPIVIVSAQEALRAVPNSIRQGAIALGATRWQTIWRTVLPMAMPGIFTGTILSLSRAIGEAAPLVLFGALLYVNQEPSLFSRFTALPMQIFDWAGRAAVTLPNGESIDLWQSNAALASLVLLTMLLGLNAIAIYLRNRSQKGTRY